MKTTEKKMQHTRTNEKMGDYFLQGTCLLQNGPADTHGSDIVIDFADPDFPDAKKSREMIERKLNAHDDLLEALKDAYKLLARVDHSWEGRNTDEGQMLLVSMRAALEKAGADF